MRVSEVETPQELASWVRIYYSGGRWEEENSILSAALAVHPSLLPF